MDKKQICEYRANMYALVGNAWKTQAFLCGKVQKPRCIKMK